MKAPQPSEQIGEPAAWVQGHYMTTEQDQAIGTRLVGIAPLVESRGHCLCSKRYRVCRIKDKVILSLVRLGVIL